jgi:hypothetical protein
MVLSGAACRFILSMLSVGSGKKDDRIISDASVVCRSKRRTVVGDAISRARRGERSLVMFMGSKVEGGCWQCCL